MRQVKRPTPARAVFQALFVTFLWSTSWVLIKIGLADLPALTFAGLRYSLAFVFMLPLVVRSAPRRDALRTMPLRAWRGLIVLGVVYIALTMGAQYVSLAYLPAATITLLLNFTTVIVALLSGVILSERPTRLQWLGIGVFLAGVLIYFYPPDFPADQTVGFIAVGVCVAANAVSAILGRRVNRRGDIDPFSVTLVSIGTGGLILLAAGLITSGLPRLSLQHVLIVLWLAAVNTAFAFTLWNHTLRTLSATESSVINNTMLIQISLLAWIFLGEALTAQALMGIALAIPGTLLVQLARRRETPSQSGAAPLAAVQAAPGDD